jgi:hypothetical protein
LSVTDTWKNLGKRDRKQRELGQVIHDYTEGMTIPKKKKREARLMKLPH